MRHNNKWIFSREKKLFLLFTHITFEQLYKFFQFIPLLCRASGLRHSNYTLYAYSVFLIIILTWNWTTCLSQPQLTIKAKTMLNAHAQKRQVFCSFQFKLFMKYRVCVFQHKTFWVGKRCFFLKSILFFWKSLYCVVLIFFLL